MNTDEAIAGINRKVRADEPDYLKYLVDNCDNIVKPDPAKYGFTPPVLQLFKIRSEALQRLEELYGIKYEGKE